MIKAKLDHKKDVYEALDEPHKALYRHALIMAIEDGQLLSEGGNGDEC